MATVDTTGPRARWRRRARTDEEPYDADRARTARMIVALAIAALIVLAIMAALT